MATSYTPLNPEQTRRIQDVFRSYGLQRLDAARSNSAHMVRVLREAILQAFPEYIALPEAQQASITRLVVGFICDPGENALYIRERMPPASSPSRSFLSSLGAYFNNGISRVWGVAPSTRNLILPPAQNQPLLNGYQDMRQGQHSPRRHPQHLQQTRPLSSSSECRDNEHLALYPSLPPAPGRPSHETVQPVTKRTSIVLPLYECRQSFVDNDADIYCLAVGRGEKVRVQETRKGMSLVGKVGMGGEKILHWGWVPSALLRRVEE